MLIVRFQNCWDQPIGVKSCVSIMVNLFQVGGLGQDDELGAGDMGELPPLNYRCHPTLFIIVRCFF